jgi:hypothetical protein
MISGMYGTTMDWLTHNMPPDVFGGGFIRRHLISAQERTDRVSAIPADISTAQKALADRIKVLTYGSGEFKFEGEARKWYIDWYATFRKRDFTIGDDRFQGYLESKPDQMLRLAMLIQITQEKKELNIESLSQALVILDWLEQYLPSTFSGMSGTALGEMEERIIKYLNNAGGRMSHSDLLRRLSKFLSATKLAEILNTLKEAEIISEKPKTQLEPRSYYLVKRGR